jgi:hypothetical protein
MKGIRIDCSERRGFESLFAPVMAEFAARYWMIDGQSGPFSITDKPNFGELDGLLDAYLVNIPDFENSSETLWRPGVFPKFADLLVVDEWTYLLGIDGPEEEALQKAVRISRIPRFSVEFFTSISSAHALLLVYQDQWWEVYADAVDVLRRFGALQNASVVDSSVLTASHKW